MVERIITRFRNEEDLKEFATRNGFTLDKDTKEYNINTHEFKVKKQGKKKGKSQEWRKHWKEMPEFVYETEEPYAKIDFIFEKDDIEKAREIYAQNVSEKSKSLWYPKLVAGSHSKLRVVGGNSKPQYPIYIVSKNRSEKCFTSRFLTQMEVDHFVVVEPQDVEKYKKHVENKYATVIELDMQYKKDYDTFSDLGKNEDGSNTGPGAARNFCWDDSIKRGYEWHWVFDDNANEGFHRLHNNKKNKCRDGSFFRAYEDFVNRYENIAQAGINYTMFCVMGQEYPAFVTNTRIYSFLLIRNDIPYRWRGRYNEDTDLSLRILKDGWCTVQFNAFTAGKATTQKIRGGNSEEFYDGEGTWNKSKMLEDMHPDCAKVQWKFSRWHHQVDYTRFKQELILKEEFKNLKDEPNNYGLEIIETEEDNTFDTKSYLEEKYDNVISVETEYKRNKKEKNNSSWDNLF